MREKPTHDGAEPSGASVATLNALRLEAFTADARWRRVADAALRLHRRALEEQPAALSEMLLALDYATDAVREVVLVWPEDGPGPEPFLEVLRDTFLPSRALTGAAEGAGIARLGAVAPSRPGRRPPAASHRVRVRARRLPAPVDLAREARLADRAGATVPVRSGVEARAVSVITDNLDRNPRKRTLRPDDDPEPDPRRPAPPLRQRQLRRHLPRGLEAMAEANAGPRARLWRRPLGPQRRPTCCARLFETDCEVFFVFNGTAANSLALASLCQSYHSDYLPRDGARGDRRVRRAGVLLQRHQVLLVPGAERQDRRRRASTPWSSGARDIHYPKPRVAQLTQATELGTVYSPRRD